QDRRCQSTATVLSDEHQMCMALPYSVPATAKRVIISHDANAIICYSEYMLKRYSYRAYPTVGQARASARAFGCARVVFNDYLRARDDLYDAGRHKDVPFSETVNDVTTRAKLTVERQWLSEVSNTVLQQIGRA